MSIANENQYNKEKELCSNKNKNSTSEITKMNMEQQKLDSNARSDSELARFTQIDDLVSATIADSLGFWEPELKVYDVSKYRKNDVECSPSSFDVLNEISSLPKRRLTNDQVKYFVTNWFVEPKPHKQRTVLPYVIKNQPIFRHTVQKRTYDSDRSMPLTGKQLNEFIYRDTPEAIRKWGPLDLYDPWRPTGINRRSDAFLVWKDYVLNNPPLKIHHLVDNKTYADGPYYHDGSKSHEMISIEQHSQRYREKRMREYESHLFLIQLQEQEKYKCPCCIKAKEKHDKKVSDRFWAWVEKNRSENYHNIVVSSPKEPNKPAKPIGPKNSQFSPTKLERQAKILERKLTIEQENERFWQSIVLVKKPIEIEFKPKKLQRCVPNFSWITGKHTKKNDQTVDDNVKGTPLNFFSTPEYTPRKRCRSPPRTWLQRHLVTVTLLSLFCVVSANHITWQCDQGIVVTETNRYVSYSKCARQWDLSNSCQNTSLTAPWLVCSEFVPICGTRQVNWAGIWQRTRECCGRGLGSKVEILTSSENVSARFDCYDTADAMRRLYDNSRRKREAETTEPETIRQHIKGVEETIEREQQPTEPTLYANPQNVGAADPAASNTANDGTAATPNNVDATSDWLSSKKFYAFVQENKVFVNGILSILIFMIFVHFKINPTFGIIAAVLFFIISPVGAVNPVVARVGKLCYYVTGDSQMKANQTYEWTHIMGSGCPKHPGAETLNCVNDYAAMVCEYNAPAPTKGLCIGQGHLSETVTAAWIGTGNIGSILWQGVGNVVISVAFVFVALHFKVHPAIIVFGTMFLLWKAPAMATEISIKKTSGCILYTDINNMTASKEYIVKHPAKDCKNKFTPTTEITCPEGQFIVLEYDDTGVKTGTNGCYDDAVIRHENFLTDTQNTFFKILKKIPGSKKFEAFAHDYNVLANLAVALLLGYFMFHFKFPPLAIVTFMVLLWFSQPISADEVAISQSGEPLLDQEVMMLGYGERSGSFCVYWTNMVEVKPKSYFIPVVEKSQCLDRLITRPFKCGEDNLGKQQFVKISVSKFDDSFGKLSPDTLYQCVTGVREKSLALTIGAIDHWNLRVLSTLLQNNNENFKFIQNQLVGIAAGDYKLSGGEITAILENLRIANDRSVTEINENEAKLKAGFDDLKNQIQIKRRMAEPLAEEVRGYFTRMETILNTTLPKWNENNDKIKAMDQKMGHMNLTNLRNSIIKQFDKSDFTVVRDYIVRQIANHHNHVIGNTTAILEILQHSNFTSLPNNLIRGVREANEEVKQALIYNKNLINDKLDTTNLTTNFAKIHDMVKELNFTKLKEDMSVIVEESKNIENVKEIHIAFQEATDKIDHAVKLLTIDKENMKILEDIGVQMPIMIDALNSHKNSVIDPLLSEALTRIEEAVLQNRRVVCQRTPSDFHGWVEENTTFIIICIAVCLSYFLFGVHSMFVLSIIVFSYIHLYSKVEAKCLTQLGFTFAGNRFYNQREAIVVNGDASFKAGDCFAYRQELAADGKNHTRIIKITNMNEVYTQTPLFNVVKKFQIWTPCTYMCWGNREYGDVSGLLQMIKDRKNYALVQLFNEHNVGNSAKCYFTTYLKKWGAITWWDEDICIFYDHKPIAINVTLEYTYSNKNHPSRSFQITPDTPGGDSDFRLTLRPGQLTDQKYLIHCPKTHRWYEWASDKPHLSDKLIFWQHAGEVDWHDITSSIYNEWRYDNPCSSVKTTKQQLTDMPNHMMREIIAPHVTLEPKLYKFRLSVEGGKIHELEKCSIESFTQKEKNHTMMWTGDGIAMAVVDIRIDINFKIPCNFVYDGDNNNGCEVKPFHMSIVEEFPLITFPFKCKGIGRFYITINNEKHNISVTKQSFWTYVAKKYEQVHVGGVWREAPGFITQWSNYIASFFSNSFWKIVMMVVVFMVVYFLNPLIGIALGIVFLAYYVYAQPEDYHYEDFEDTIATKILKYLNLIIFAALVTKKYWRTFGRLAWSFWLQFLASFSPMFIMKRIPKKLPIFENNPHISEQTPLIKFTIWFFVIFFYLFKIFVEFYLWVPLSYYTGHSFLGIMYFVHLFASDIFWSECTILKGMGLAMNSSFRNSRLSLEYLGDTRLFLLYASVYYSWDSLQGNTSSIGMWLLTTAIPVMMKMWRVNVYGRRFFVALHTVCPEDWSSVFDVVCDEQFLFDTKPPKTNWANDKCTEWQEEHERTGELKIFKAVCPLHSGKSGQLDYEFTFISESWCDKMGIHCGTLTCQRHRDIATQKNALFEQGIAMYNSQRYKLVEEEVENVDTHDPLTEEFQNVWSRIENSNYRPYIPVKVEWSMIENMNAKMGIRAYFPKSNRISADYPKIATIENERNGTIGYGFYYQGSFITCYHVAEGAEIILPDRGIDGRPEKRLCEATFVDPNNDIAIYGPLSSFRTPDVGEWAVVPFMSQQQFLVLRCKAIHQGDRSVVVATWERFVMAFDKTGRKKAVLSAAYGFYGCSGSPIISLTDYQVVGVWGYMYNDTTGDVPIGPRIVKSVFALPNVGTFNWGPKAREILNPQNFSKSIVKIEAQTGSGKSTYLPIATSTVLFEQNPGAGSIVLCLNPLVATTISLPDHISSVLAADGKASNIVCRFMTGKAQSKDFDEIERESDTKHVILICSYGKVWSLLERFEGAGRLKCVYLDESHYMSPEVAVVMMYMRYMLQCDLSPYVKRKIPVCEMSATLGGGIAERPIITVESPKPNPVEKWHFAIDERQGFYYDARHFKGHKAMIFVPTTAAVERLYAKLISKQAVDCGIDTSNVFEYYSKHKNGVTNLHRFNVAKEGIIICTDALESGITIVGASVVYDTCLKNIEHFYEGDVSMIIVPISKASQIQRRGRAGRTGQQGKYIYPAGAQIREYDEFDQGTLYRMASRFKTKEKTLQIEFPPELVYYRDVLERLALDMNERTHEQTWSCLAGGAINPYTFLKLAHKDPRTEKLSWHRDIIELNFGQMKSEYPHLSGIIAARFPISLKEDLVPVGAPKHYAVEKLIAEEAAKKSGNHYTEKVKKMKVEEKNAGLLSSVGSTALLTAGLGATAAYTLSEVISKFYGFAKVTGYWYAGGPDWSDFLWSMQYDFITGYDLERLEGVLLHPGGDPHLAKTNKLVSRIFGKNVHQEEILNHMMSIIIEHNSCIMRNFSLTSSGRLIFEVWDKAPEYALLVKNRYLRMYGQQETVHPKAEFGDEFHDKCKALASELNIPDDFTPLERLRLDRMTSKQRGDLREWARQKHWTGHLSTGYVSEQTKIATGPIQHYGETISPQKVDVEEKNGLVVTSQWLDYCKVMANECPQAAPMIAMMMQSGYVVAGGMALTWDQLCKNFGATGAMGIGVMAVALTGQPDKVIESTIGGLFAYVGKTLVLGPATTNFGTKLPSSPFYLASTLFAGNLLAGLRKDHILTTTTQPGFSLTPAGQIVSTENASTILAVKCLYYSFRELKKLMTTGKCDIVGLTGNLGTAVLQMSNMGIFGMMTTITATTLVFCLQTAIGLNRTWNEYFVGLTAKGKDNISAALGYVPSMQQSSDLEENMESMILVCLSIASLFISPSSCISAAILGGWAFIEEMINRNQPFESHKFVKIGKDALVAGSGLPMWMALAMVSVKAFKVYMEHTSSPLVEAGPMPGTSANVEQNGKKNDPYESIKRFLIKMGLSNEKIEEIGVEKNSLPMFSFIASALSVITSVGWVATNLQNPFKDEMLSSIETNNLSISWKRIFIRVVEGIGSIFVAIGHGLVWIWEKITNIPKAIMSYWTYKDHVQDGSASLYCIDMDIPYESYARNYAMLICPHSKISGEHHPQLISKLDSCFIYAKHINHPMVMRAFAHLRKDKFRDNLALQYVVPQMRNLNFDKLKEMYKQMSPEADCDDFQIVGSSGFSERGCFCYSTITTKQGVYVFIFAVIGENIPVYIVIHLLGNVFTCWLINTFCPLEPGIPLNFAKPKISDILFNKLKYCISEITEGMAYIVPAYCHPHTIDMHKAIFDEHAKFEGKIPKSEFIEYYESSAWRVGFKFFKTRWSNTEDAYAYFKRIVYGHEEFDEMYTNFLPPPDHKWWNKLHLEFTSIVDCYIIKTADKLLYDSRIFDSRKNFEVYDYIIKSEFDLKNHLLEYIVTAPADKVKVVINELIPWEVVSPYANSTHWEDRIKECYADVKERFVPGKLFKFVPIGQSPQEKLNEIVDKLIECRRVHEKVSKELAQKEKEKTSKKNLLKNFLGITGKSKLIAPGMLDEDEQDKYLHRILRENYQMIENLDVDRRDIMKLYPDLVPEDLSGCSDIKLLDEEGKQFSTSQLRLVEINTIMQDPLRGINIERDHIPTEEEYYDAQEQFNDRFSDICLGIEPTSHLRESPTDELETLVKLVDEPKPSIDLTDELKPSVKLVDEPKSSIDLTGEPKPSVNLVDYPKPSTISLDQLMSENRAVLTSSCQKTEPLYAYGIPSGEGKTTLVKLHPDKFLDHDDYCDPIMIRSFGDDWESKNAYLRSVEMPLDGRILLTWHPDTTPENFQYQSHLLLRKETGIRLNIQNRQDLINTKKYKMFFFETCDQRNMFLISTEEKLTSLRPKNDTLMTNSSIISSERFSSQGIDTLAINSSITSSERFSSQGVDISVTDSSITSSEQFSSRSVNTLLTDSSIPSEQPSSQSVNISTLGRNSSIISGEQFTSQSADSENVSVGDQPGTSGIRKRGKLVEKNAGDLGGIWNWWTRTELNPVNRRDKSNTTNIPTDKFWYHTYLDNIAETWHQQNDTTEEDILLMTLRQHKNRGVRPMMDPVVQGLDLATAGPRWVIDPCEEGGEGGLALWPNNGNPVVPISVDEQVLISDLAIVRRLAEDDDLQYHGRHTPNENTLVVDEWYYHMSDADKVFQIFSQYRSDRPGFFEIKPVFDNKKILLVNPQPGVTQYISWFSKNCFIVIHADDHPALISHKSNTISYSKITGELTLYEHFDAIVVYCGRESNTKPENDCGPTLKYEQYRKWQSNAIYYTDNPLDDEFWKIISYMGAFQTVYAPTTSNGRFICFVHTPRKLGNEPKNFSFISQWQKMLIHTELIRQKRNLLGLRRMPIKKISYPTLTSYDTTEWSSLPETRGLKKDPQRIELMKHVLAPVISRGGTDKWPSLKETFSNRLGRVDSICKEKHIFLGDPAQITHYENMVILGTYKKSHRPPPDSCIVMAHTNAIARHLTGWEPINSSVVQVSKDMKKVAESIGTRMNRHMFQPDRTYQDLLWENMWSLRVDTQVKFKPMSFEECKRLINKQGAAGMLDKWSDMQACLEDPETEGLVLKCMARLDMGVDCNFYQTIHHKVESKVSYDGKTTPRLINYGDCISRIVDWMVYGPFVDHHMRKGKLFYGEAPNIAMQDMGDHLKSLWDRWEQLSVTKQQETGEGFEVWAAMGDASKFDHSLYKELMVDEIEFICSFYEPQYWKLIKNLAEHIIWPVCFTRLGFVFSNVGHRPSGHLLTWFNSFTNANLHTLAWKRTLNLPVSTTYDELNQFVTFIGKGDDNIHIGPQYIVNKKNMDTVCMHMSKMNIEIRSKDSSGYNLTNDFTCMDFLSHYYVPTYITCEASDPKARPPIELSAARALNSNIGTSNATIGVFSKWHKIKYLPWRPIEEILGKLVYTMKQVTMRSTINVREKSIKGFELTRAEDDAISIESSKMISYLLQYPHICLVRCITLAVLSNIGFAPELKHLDSYWYKNIADKLEDVWRIHKGKPSTLIGAFQKVYGSSIESLDDIALVDRWQEAKSMRSHFINVKNACDLSGKACRQDIRKCIRNDKYLLNFCNASNMAWKTIGWLLQTCNRMGAVDVNYPQYLGFWRITAKAYLRFFHKLADYADDYEAFWVEKYNREWFAPEAMARELYDKGKGITLGKVDDVLQWLKQHVPAPESLPVPQFVRDLVPTISSNRQNEPMTSSCQKTEQKDQLKSANRAPLIAYGIPSGEGKTTLARSYPDMFIDHDDFCDHTVLKSLGRQWTRRNAYLRNVEIPRDGRILLTWGPDTTPKGFQYKNHLLLRERSAVRMNAQNRYDLMNDKRYVTLFFNDYGERNSFLIVEKSKVGVYSGDSLNPNQHHQLQKVDEGGSLNPNQLGGLNSNQNHHTVPFIRNKRQINRESKYRKVNEFQKQLVTRRSGGFIEASQKALKSIKGIFSSGEPGRNGMENDFLVKAGTESPNVLSNVPRSDHRFFNKPAKRDRLVEKDAKESSMFFRCLRGLVNSRSQTEVLDIPKEERQDRGTDVNLPYKGRVGGLRGVSEIRMDKKRDNVSALEGDAGSFDHRLKVITPVIFAALLSMVVMSNKGVKQGVKSIGKMALIGTAVVGSAYAAKNLFLNTQIPMPEQRQSNSVDIQNERDNNCELRRYREIPGTCGSFLFRRCIHPIWLKVASWKIWLRIQEVFDKFCFSVVQLFLKSSFRGFKNELGNKHLQSQNINLDRLSDWWQRFKATESSYSDNVDHSTLEINSPITSSGQFNSQSVDETQTSDRSIRSRDQVTNLGPISDTLVSNSSTTSSEKFAYLSVNSTCVDQGVCQIDNTSDALTCKTTQLSDRPIISRDQFANLSRPSQDALSKVKGQTIRSGLDFLPLIQDGVFNTQS